MCVEKVFMGWKSKKASFDSEIPVEICSWKTEWRPKILKYRKGNSWKIGENSKNLEEKFVENSRNFTDCLTQKNSRILEEKVFGKL